MKPGRIVMLVLGTLAALMGLGLLTAAGAVGWVNFQQRDNGYFTTPTERYDVATRAITSPGMDVLVDEELPDVLPVDSAGRMLLRGTSASGQEIFIGIGPQEDVARYLADVRHSEITDLDWYPVRVQYREVPGDAVPAAPGAQPFWSTSAQGSGTQQIEWDLRSGRWTAVVMNADGGAPVSVDLQAGVRSDLLWPVFIGLLIGGIVLLVVGVPDSAGTARRRISRSQDLQDPRPQRQWALRPQPNTQQPPTPQPLRRSRPETGARRSQRTLSLRTPPGTRCG